MTGGCGACENRGNLGVERKELPRPNVYQEFEEECTFCLLGEFDSNEAMSNHFQSRNLQVLLGAAIPPHRLSLI
jgi:hypothetical protein